MFQHIEGIVHREHAHVPPGNFNGQGWHIAALSRTHPDGENEPGPFARNGFTPDIAAHHFNDAFGDGEAKPGAAVFAGNAVVRLDERLEQLGLLFLTDADAGIADFYLQRANPVRLCNFLGG